MLRYNNILFTMYVCIVLFCGVLVLESGQPRRGMMRVGDVRFRMNFWLPCSPLILIGKKLDSTCKGQFTGLRRVNIKIPRALLGNQMICLVMELAFSNRVLQNFQSKYVVIIRNLQMVRFFQQEGLFQVLGGVWAFPFMEACRPQLFYLDLLGLQ